MDEHDSFCGCGPCRLPRVRARFEAQPSLYQDFAALASWWCLERAFRGELNEGNVWRLVESPLTRPNGALESLRRSLACFFD